MGVPSDPESRRYYRASKQRLEDSELLLANGRTTGAMYLAGYAVECMLKTALLTNARGKLRGRLIDRFRGYRAHDIGWLASEFRSVIKSQLPRSIIRHLARVAPWSTDLRYEPGLVRPDDAGDFFESVRVLTDWLDKGI